MPDDAREIIRCRECQKETVLCDWPLRLADGSIGQCGLPYCPLHGCDRGHQPGMDSAKAAARVKLLRSGPRRAALSEEPEEPPPPVEIPEPTEKELAAGEKAREQHRKERDRKRGPVPEQLRNDKAGWVMVESAGGLVRVKETQELPEGFDALGEQERAAALRGEHVYVKRRCFVTGCFRKVAICDEKYVGDAGKKRLCGYSNCYQHGCSRGHPPKSKEERLERRKVKQASAAKKAAEAKPEVPEKADTRKHTPETVLEVRAAYENGMSAKEITATFHLGTGTLKKWVADDEPDGTAWKVRPGGQDISVIQQRPPDFYQWLDDVKFKILDEEEGGGWVSFVPWPRQREIIDARLAKKPLVISKSTRIGVTTCVQVCDMYSFIWRGPFYGHWVSKDFVHSQLRMQEMRDMFDQAELPDWQSAGLSLGGTSTTTAYFRAGKWRNTINTHAPGLGTARGLAGTALLMDEAAFMPYQQKIYEGFVGRLADNPFNIMIVSSANRDDNWFRYMLDHAHQFGMEAWLLDYHARPGRDEEWFEEQVERMGGDVAAAEQEFMGKVDRATNDAFDTVQMQRYAMEVPYIGDQADPERFYAIGIDQSGSGAAHTVAVIVDISDVPAQVTRIAPFHYDDALAMTGIGRTQQKARWIDALGEKYNAICYVDCTTDQATVEFMKWPGKVMVRFRGIEKITEATDGPTRVFQYPRMKLLENAILLTETGRVVVHEHHDMLYTALRTARRYGDVEARKRPTTASATRPKKMSGKQFGDNVDELDAFLLSCVALTELGGGSTIGGSAGYVSRKSGTPRNVWSPPKRRLWRG